SVLAGAGNRKESTKTKERPHVRWYGQRPLQPNTREGVFCPEVRGSRLPSGYLLRGGGVAERRRCPRSCRIGDPLIVAVGEDGVEVRLDLWSPALHMPGAIILLSPEQVLDTAFVSGVADRHAKLVHGKQSLAGCVSVARHIEGLAPAAVLAL